MPSMRHFFLFFLRLVTVTGTGNRVGSLKQIGSATLVNCHVYIKKLPLNQLNNFVYEPTICKKDNTPDLELLLVLLTKVLDPYQHLIEKIPVTHLILSCSFSSSLRFWTRISILLAASRFAIFFVAPSPVSWKLSARREEDEDPVVWSVFDP